MNYHYIKECEEKAVALSVHLKTGEVIKPPHLSTGITFLLLSGQSGVPVLNVQVVYAVDGVHDSSGFTSVPYDSISHIEWRFKSCMD